MVKIVLTTLSFVLFSTQVMAESLLNVKVVSVHDGDTFNISNPALPDVFGKNLPVRVYGIDAPEIHGHLPCEQKKAQEAREVASELLMKAELVTLLNVKRDKYFRILAEVKADGVDLKDLLLSRHLAYPYYGKTKARKNWCKE